MAKSSGGGASGSGGRSKSGKASVRSSIFDKGFSNVSRSEASNLLRSYRRKLGTPTIRNDRGNRVYTFDHNVFDKVTVIIPKK